VTQRFLLFALLLGGAEKALAWGDIAAGIGLDQSDGTQMDVGLNFSPQGWWALGGHARCSAAGLCAAEARLRASLEVFRTVPRWSVGFGTRGIMTSLMLDRFLTRQSSFRGELGWRSQGGVFAFLGLGYFPFD